MLSSRKFFFHRKRKRYTFYKIFFRERNFIVVSMYTTALHSHHQEHHHNIFSCSVGKKEKETRQCLCVHRAHIHTHEDTTEHHFHHFHPRPVLSPERERSSAHRILLEEPEKKKIYIYLLARLFLWKELSWYSLVWIVLLAEWVRWLEREK